MNLSLALPVVFAATYSAIALEHPLKINKSATALLGAGVLWTLYALGSQAPDRASAQLGESLMATAQIVFFLMGAMAIVEVVDAHHGFDVVTARIRTRRLPVLMVIISTVTFFLSAVLDNLTTTIVMVSLVRKVLPDQDDRLAFASMVVVAANAGGVWTPIGDVTTTMLWIGGQITPWATIRSLFLPSLACLAIPMAASAYMLRGRRLEAAAGQASDQQGMARPGDRNLMFFLGLSVLVGVPVFKAITHLPPFMGILFGLGLLWVVGDLLHRHKPEAQKQRLTLVHALSQIDLPSVMFFVGILLCVATLEHAGLLATLASHLDQAIGRQDLIVLMIGAASAVVDNVPLVAACMGMYPLTEHPADSFLWQFLAYCTGTGGSILIIGSAAGVAAMGIEGIRFGWYFRRVSALALFGYLSGAAIFLLQHSLLT